MIGKTKRYTLCAFRKINVGSSCIFIDVDMLASCTIYQVCRHFVVVSIFTLILMFQLFHSSRDYYQDLINHIRLLLNISYDLSLSLRLYVNSNLSCQVIIVLLLSQQFFRLIQSANVLVW